jgi:RNA polymerase sigma-70 factor (ECF subfamily)
MSDSLHIQKFNHLYRAYRDRFIRFAGTYVYDTEQAEDIVMESFMYYWENRLNIKEDNIPAYILAMIKHKCLNFLYKLRKREEVESFLHQRGEWELNIQIATLEACNPKTLFSDEVQSLVNKALTTLPEQTREIFIRSRYDNQSHKQIATDMDLSVKSIEYHLTKALKVLRVTLKDYFLFFL